MFKIVIDKQKEKHEREQEFCDKWDPLPPREQPEYHISKYHISKCSPMT